MSIAVQLKYRHENKFLIGKTLSRAVTIASSIGELAEKGKRLSVNQSGKDRLIAMIQLGEYVMTGEVPSQSLILDVIEVV